MFLFFSRTTVQLFKTTNLITTGNISSPYMDVYRHLFVPLLFVGNLLPQDWSDIPIDLV